MNRTALRGRAFARGFTMIELLTVMAVIATIFGLAVGSLARAGKAGALEGGARLARSHLMRARMLSLSGGALSRVTFTPAAPERNERAAVVTEFSRVAGSWHFDDENPAEALFGEDRKSRVYGAMPTADGRFRGGMEFQGPGRVVSPPVETLPTFDPSRGFSLFFDVRPAGPGVLARFGTPTGGAEAFHFAIDDTGALSAEIETVFDAATAAAAQKAKSIKLKTRPAVIETLAWARVGLSYDGVTAEIFAHGVSEAVATDWRDIETPEGACLVFGGGFQGVLDEAVYSTTSAPERHEFESAVEVESETPVVVRFDRSGRLNERFHSTPVVMTLELEGRRTTVVVDPTGIVQ